MSCKLVIFPNHFFFFFSLELGLSLQWDCNKERRKHNKKLHLNFIGKPNCVILLTNML